MTDPALGTRPVPEDDASLVDIYRIVAEDLRRCLMLADIAADHGNGRRASDHLLTALAELVPELTILETSRKR